MILEIGISRMPVAPASLSAGISVLIWFLATTVSTAKPPSPASSLTVGDLSDGHEGEHRVELLGADVHLHEHLAAGVERAVEQRHQLLHRVALGRVVVRRHGWR